MIIRRATAADIDLLVQMRMAYLSEHGMPDEAVREKLKDYFDRWLGGDGFMALLGEVDGRTVSTAFLTVEEQPPRSLTTGRKGTVYNVYTDPAFRRQGLAERMMHALVDEARRMNVNNIDLLATEDGKSLYEKLGFSRPNYTYMRLKL